MLRLGAFLMQGSFFWKFQMASLPFLNGEFNLVFALLQDHQEAMGTLILSPFSTAQAIQKEPTVFTDSVKVDEPSPECLNCSKSCDRMLRKIEARTALLAWASSVVGLPISHISQVGHINQYIPLKTVKAFAGFHWPGLCVTFNCSCICLHLNANTLQVCSRACPNEQRKLTLRVKDALRRRIKARKQ